MLDNHNWRGLPAEREMLQRELLEWELLERGLLEGELPALKLGLNSKACMRVAYQLFASWTFDHIL